MRRGIPEQGQRRVTKYEDEGRLHGGAVHAMMQTVVDPQSISWCHIIHILANQAGTR